MRAEKTITLNDNGNELTFRIKKMPAMKLQGWLLRAALVLLRSTDMKAEAVAKINSDGDIVNGMLKVISENWIGILAYVDSEKAEPLIHELLECCTLVDGNVNTKVSADIVDGMITEVKNLLLLEKEAALLNLGFLAPADQSGSIAVEQVSAAGDTQKRRISIRSQR